jgi:hypothetical protein
MCISTASTEYLYKRHYTHSALSRSTSLCTTPTMSHFYGIDDDHTLTEGTNPSGRSASSDMLDMLGGVWTCLDIISVSTHARHSTPVHLHIQPPMIIIVDMIMISLSLRDQDSVIPAWHSPFTRIDGQSDTRRPQGSAPLLRPVTLSAVERSARASRR